MNNKQSTRGQHFKRRFLPLLLAACCGLAQAAPSAPQVVAGQASFLQQGNVFSIMNTPNTIINWQSFSVNAGEITRFIQQDANSAVLNRIVGQDPSQILGALQSNGRVFLINPNGILFGRDAKVDVRGLTASTLQLSDADFLAGRKNFTAGAVAGKLSNEGTISAAPGGQVFLIAGDVENSGIVHAPDGQVVLAAGHSVQLVDPANPDLQVVVAAPNARAVNLGQVIAQGGKIGIYGALVSQRGTVSADSAVVGANGKIVLKASRDALLEAGSVTSATGAGHGGTVHVLGERVALDGDARIDASGAAGGGTVLVGGDYQGKNAQLPNAQHTWMGKDASIRADAGASGKGGKVVLWSDGATQAYGNISVRGGAAGGDGGFVETSGKTLAVSGARIDAGAAKGASGTWLLDPDYININSAAANGALPVGGLVAFADNPAGTTTISTFDIANATANVVLEALVDINVNDAVNVASGKSLTLRANNNITIAAQVGTSGSNANLTLEANNNININAPIWLQGTNGILTIKADKDNNATGDVVVNGTLVTASGSLEMSGNNITIDAGGGVDLDGTMSFKARDTFTLGAGRIIDGSSPKTIQANKIAINGNITGGGDVHIGPELPSRGIDINTSKPGSALEITPAELNRITAQNLYLGGDWMSGPVKVSSAFAPAAGNASGLFLHTQGQIDIIGNIDMTANSFPYLEVERFGSATGRINLTGQVKTFNAVLRSNNINLAGQIVTTNGSTGKGYVTLGTQRMSQGSATGTNAAIQIGAGAVEGAGVLALTEAQLLNISADQLSIGMPDGDGGNLTVTGALNLSSMLGATSPLFLDAGGAMAINGALQSGGEINLSASGAVTQTGTITGAGLQVQAGSATLNQTNMVNTIAAATTGDFSLKNGQNLIVGLVGDTVGIDNNAGSGKVTLDVAGMLYVNNTIDAGGSVALTAAGIGGDAMVIAPNRLDLVSTAGIGTLGGALSTSTSNLSAINTLANGSAPIKINNNRGAALNLNKVAQAGAGNVGIIDITTTIGMVVRATDSTSGAAAGVQSVNGDIFLVTNSPLTVDGPVSSSGGGAVSLTANNGGAVTINSASALTTTSGDVTITGGSIVHNGAINSTSGDVTFNAAPTSISGSGTVTTSGAIAGYTGPAGPTVLACLSNPALAGCTAVLAAALDACIANPEGANCSALLPSLATCTANPATTGCSVVLPPLATCVAAPSTPGCTAVLPSLSTCVSNPGAPGCSVVLPTLSQCIASPGDAGCSVVLPSLSTCQSNPATAGCSVVLPSLSSCIANPSAPGCGNVLPGLDACIAEPAAAGCSVVLPSLDACIANPGGAGCSVVLPSLSSCVANPTAPGCSVVLPPLDACVANPAAAGCTVVLPSLPTCVSNPAAPGCSAVLPPLSTCVANPAAAGCSVVLPSLPSCVANPAAPGCSVVLPSIAACVANPAAAGCSAVLPTLPTCIAAPATAGCSVVLPTLSVCIAAPATAGCSVVLPTLSACIAAPATAGCTVVLPTLPACIAAPATAGCSVVLPTLSACIAAPATAGCSVVLPTLAACIAAPATAGCSVVLPTLAQCTAMPALAGCSVVLPTLAQCTATPALAGCGVVLPPVSACAANPTAPGCTVVLPTPDICNISPDSALCQVLAPPVVDTRNPVNVGTNLVVQMVNEANDKTSLSPSVPTAGKEDTKEANALDKKVDAKTGTTLLGGKDVQKKTYCN